jgi:glycosyltransferase involved in cell wall biosynthesis
MHVTLLVPDIHDRPTGGNLYNRRMVAELQDTHTVDVHSWTPTTDTALPAPPHSGPVLVDSLLARHDEALPRLRRRHPGPLVLLAHYLHCIDPREDTAPAARTERAVLPLFDAVVTTSRFAQRALLDEGGAPSRIHVVPPGLDDPYRAPLPDGSSNAPPHLLTVASWLPGKGLSTLIDQLDTLDALDWHWTLVGDDTLNPDFADTVRARLRDTSIADRITAPGPVAPEAMRDRYDAADLFVLPSRFETCSMATREALARGLPVVGYDVGGMAENFGDNDAGCLVPPDRPDAFADALRRLLTEPETRAAMSTAARTRSEDFPTWTTAAARLQSFLQSLY